MNIVELKDKKISELTQMAKKFKIDGAAGMRKQELIFSLLQAQIEQEETSAVAETSTFASPDVKTKIHTGRVRSGQQIYAKECDLVINGDVSAGAEVIADGNIHIYGALRGKALAGAMGEKSASIFCQLLSPELVSIAGVYKLSDDLSADFAGKSCIVSLQDEQIVLANLSRV